MHRSVAVLLLLVALPIANSFLWGGGCCSAPVSSCCGGATSWAYAPPQIIGYERIPLYAKVPMPAPQAYYRPRPVVVQSQPYYPPPPPPPAPTTYQDYPPSPPMTAMDSVAPAPTSSSVSAPVSSVSSPLTSAIPVDKYDDGDVIVIETDDARRRRMMRRGVVQPPPPTGYVSSQPVQPQGYGVGPQQQQPIVGGQVENGIEVTPDQIASGYQPLNSGSQSSMPTSDYGAQQSAGLVESVAHSAAYEATGMAPSARRLRKFKN